MLSGPRPITTLLLCKPDVVQRHLAKLFRRVMQEGFTIVGMRLIMLNKQEALMAVPEEDQKVLLKLFLLLWKKITDVCTFYSCGNIKLVHCQFFSDLFCLTFQ
jgi:nucleoside diphosphate kinase